MNVWVLIEDYGYEGHDVVGVYTSLLEAQAAAGREGLWNAKLAEFTVDDRKRLIKDAFKACSGSLR